MATEKVEVEILTEIKKSLTSLAKYTAAITGAAIAVGQAIRTVKALTDEYKQQVVQETKLAAALKATGGAVGISKNEMMAYADQLSRMTAIDDDAIVGAQALMTTFTRVGKDVFPTAIEAAADMSAMFGQDLQQSVIQLGTALNDPIAGVGRLRRIGISFTEDQQALIKSLMEENDVLGAQRVILDELGVEIGGTAKLMGTTAVGAVDSLNNAWQNLKAEGGRTILEFIKPAVVKLTELINKTVDARKEYENWEKAVAGGADADYKSAIEIQIEKVAELEVALEKNAETAKLLEERGYGGYAVEARLELQRRLTIEKDRLELMKHTNHELYMQTIREKAVAQLLKEAEDKRKQEKADMDELTEAWEKTLKGQIAAKEAEIKYWAAWKQGPMVQDIIAKLSEELKGLNEQLAGDKENPFAGMEAWVDEAKLEAARIRWSNYFAWLEDKMETMSEYSDSSAGPAGAGSYELSKEATAAYEERMKQYSAEMDAAIALYELRRSLQAQENDLFNRALDERMARIEKEAQAYINSYGKIAEAMGTLLVDQEKGLAALKNAFKDLIISELRALAVKWAATAIMNIPVNPALAAGYAAAAAAATAGIGVVSALGSGGLVTGPTPAIVGERGPELVTPLSDIGKLGGDTINVTINGSMIHERQVEDMIIGAVARSGRGY